MAIIIKVYNIDENDQVGARLKAKNLSISLTALQIPA